jgi:hypothetical protein
MGERERRRRGARRPARDRFEPAGYFRAGSTLVSATLPGLAFPVAGLFEVPGQDPAP